MADIFDNLNVDDKKTDTSSGDVFDSVVYTTKTNSDVSPVAPIVGGAVALGAVGGAGLLTKKAISAYRQPWNERNAILRQIDQEAKLAGVPSGQSVGMLPKTISSLTEDYKRNQGDLMRKSSQQFKLGQSNLEGRLSEVQNQIGNTKSSYANKIKNVNYEANQTLTSLKQSLKEFDDTILNRNIDDAAYAIKGSYDGIFSNGYSKYRSMLTNVEKIMEEKGVQLNTLSFDGEVINKTLSELQNSTPQEKLSSLKPILREATQSERPISFSEAKKYYEQVRDSLPSAGKRKLAYNWGKFIEKNAPQEVGGILSSTNQKYGEFIELGNQLNSMSKSKVGNFDDEGVYRFLSDYVKKAQDQSKENLLKILTEGDDFFDPIPGVGEKVSKLKEAAKTRSGMTDSIRKAELARKTQISEIAQEGQGKVAKLTPQSEMLSKAVKQTKVSRGVRLTRMASAAKEEIDRLVAWRKKAEQLVDRAKVAQKKIDARAISQKVRAIPIVGEIGKIVNKGLPALSVYTQLRDALQGATLGDMAYSAQGGGSVEEAMATRKAMQGMYQGKEPSPEEMFKIWRAGGAI